MLSPALDINSIKLELFVVRPISLIPALLMYTASG
jgi:hypothetical protein